MKAFQLSIVARDVLREINSDDVSQMPLSDIPRVLGAAKRPVCMKLERAVMALTFADTVRDPRKVCSCASCVASLPHRP